MSEAIGGLIGIRAFVRMTLWEGPREQSTSRESRVQIEGVPNSLGGGPETQARGQRPAGRGPSPGGAGGDRTTSTKRVATLRRAE